jgi:hypothetical protein
MEERGRGCAGEVGSGWPGAGAAAWGTRGARVREHGNAGTAGGEGEGRVREALRGRENEETKKP